MRRRDFVSAAIAAPVAVGLARCSGSSRWDGAAYRRPPTSRVAILKAPRYDGTLLDTVLAGLRLFSLPVAGKMVVLKPNLVEFDPTGVINTHPAVIAAAIEGFRRLGARRVVVAEGPGHRRDNAYLLGSSGLGHLLRDTRSPYVDLNYDDARRVPAITRFTDLAEFHLPETVLQADLLVSMPKLKVHHWAGATLSMKNMFGIMPGAVYGWPKNRLHWAGIDESIVDINAALHVPRFAIVDGVVGMEGNGPIQGSARASGVLVFGEDPVAVDASAARLMMLAPTRIKHLAWAGDFLGNVRPEAIAQIGEPLEPLRQDFKVIPSLEHLKVSA